jgi:hypothetical protein
MTKHEGSLKHVGKTRRFQYVRPAQGEVIRLLVAKPQVLTISHSHGKLGNIYFTSLDTIPIRR